MAALIEGQFFLHGLETRSPAISAVINVKITATVIQRHIVVPIACEPPQACILIESIAAGSIGDQAEKFLRAQVVDPWVGSFWGCNHIFPVLIIKVPELHLIAP